MYSIVNLCEQVESLVFKNYLKKNPLSLYLANLSLQGKSQVKKIRIKQEFAVAFRKNNLSTKEDFSRATKEFVESFVKTAVNFENQRFLMRLKRLEQIKVVTNLDSLKVIQPNPDIILLCHEKTKAQLLKHDVALRCKTFEGFPINQGIVTSIGDFLSKCSIKSLNIVPKGEELNFSIKCLDFENNYEDYGRYIFDLEERKKLTSEQIEEFISEHYKLSLSYEFSLELPSDNTCIFFEL